MSDKVFDTLLENAQRAVESYELDLAAKFFQKAIELQPTNENVLEACAEVYVELGNAEMAAQLFMRCVELEPSTGASKYMNLGQLQQGEAALATYKKGVEIMALQKAELEANRRGAADALAELNRQLACGLCSIAELYMTDLCFAPDAEGECGRCLERAIAVDASHFEAHLQMANFLVCAQRRDDAIKALSRAKALCHAPDLQSGNVDMRASYHSRAGLAKLMVELEMHEDATQLMQVLLAEDDQQAEVWLTLAVMHRNKNEAEPAAECIVSASKIMSGMPAEEVDPTLAQQIQVTLDEIKEECTKQNIPFDDGNDEEEPMVT